MLVSQREEQGYRIRGSVPKSLWSRKEGKVSLHRNSTQVESRKERSKFSAVGSRATLTERVRSGFEERVVFETDLEGWIGFQQAEMATRRIYERR